jgi:hypothetical protein
LTPKEKVLTDKFAEDKKHFVAQGLNQSIEALHANDVALAKRVIEQKVLPLYESLTVDIQDLLILQFEISKQEFETANSCHDNIRNIAIGLMAAGISLVLLLGISLIQTLVRPLKAQTDDMDSSSPSGCHNAPSELTGKRGVRNE